MDSPIDRSRLISTFLALVAIDSPTHSEDAVAAEVRRRLDRLGLRTDTDARGNLYGFLDGPGEAFLLSAHMDTVEPGRGIRPVVDGDIIRSDGSTILGGDPEAGIAEILEALEAARAEGAALRNLEILFTRGEEIGLDGAKAADYGKLSARAGVVFDGEGDPETLTTEAPFILTIDGRVGGLSAHAGVEPEKGLSALRVAMDLLASFPQGRLDEETTANLGRLEGGLVRNAVPDSCTFLAEVRSRDAQKVEAQRLALEEAAARTRSRYPDAAVDLDVKLATHGFKLPADHPAVAEATRALHACGLEPRLVASGGATDANVFAGHGIFAVVAGMGGAHFHTTRETASITAMVNAARFCHALVRN